jgi:hypothetical protein
MFSADVVAVVLMASGTISLTMKQYEMMSALDGTRTTSSFQHAFRAVLAKSKELKGRVENGEVFEPVLPAIKRGLSSCSLCIMILANVGAVGGTTGTASPATPKKRKNAGDDSTPSKRKVTPKTKAGKALTNAFGSSGEDLPEDIDEFGKY